MRKRCLPLQISFLMLILICSGLACGSVSDKPVVLSTPKEGNNNEILQPSVTPELGTSRFNPAPYGSEVLSDNLIISITELIRPADQLVLDGNIYNSTPEDGKEYSFIKLRIVCNRAPDQKCSFTSFDFKLVDTAGNVEENEMFTMGVENILEGGELFGGASEEGYLIFIVDKAELHPVLMYEPFIGESVYFYAYN